MCLDGAGRVVVGQGVTGLSFQCSGSQAVSHVHAVIVDVSI